MLDFQKAEKAAKKSASEEKKTLREEAKKERERKKAKQEQDADALLAEIEADTGEADMKVAKEVAGAIARERTALLGYCLGDLLEDKIYTLKFGQQTNDRPTDKQAANGLAAAMDKETNRYNKQSLIKVPISNDWITDDLKAALFPTREFDIDEISGDLSVRESLPSLADLLTRSYLERTGREFGPDSKAMVLKPVGGQHRTEAVRILHKRYIEANKTDAKTLLVLQDARDQAEKRLQQERRDEPLRAEYKLPSFAECNTHRTRYDEMFASIRRRKRFLKDGGKWLFAIYEESTS